VIVALLMRRKYVCYATASIASKACPRGGYQVRDHGLRYDRAVTGDGVPVRDASGARRGEDGNDAEVE
jgi:hypothetical protein